MSVLSLIYKLQPKEVRSEDLDKLRLKKTEAVHNYMIYSHNESQNLNVTPENKFMLEYESRLFDPNVYGHFLL